MFSQALIWVLSTHVYMHFVYKLEWDVWLTHDEMHFMCSLAWEELGQLMLRYIFLLAGKGWV